MSTNRALLGLSAVLIGAFSLACYPDDGYQGYYYDCSCDRIIGVCEPNCPCDPDCQGPPVSSCACDYYVGVCEQGCACNAPD